MASKGRKLLAQFDLFLLIRLIHTETDVLVQGQKLRHKESVVLANRTFRLASKKTRNEYGN